MKAGITLAYRQGVFYADYILCATAFFVFWSKEFSLGGVGCLRLPSEALMLLLSLLGLFTVAGQKKWLHDLGWVREGRPWALEMPRWIGLYLLWLWISSAFSTLPWVAFKASAAFTWCVIPAYYWVYKILRENPKSNFGPRIIFWAIMGLGSFSIYGMIHYWALNPLPIEKIFRVPQPFLSDHTHWGAMCVLLLFPSFYMSRYGRGKGVRIFSALSVVLLLVGLWISHGRAAGASGVIAIAIGLMVLLWQKTAGTRTKRVGWIAGFVVVSILAIGALTWQGQEKKIEGKSESWTENMLALVNYKQDPSSMERLNRWKCAWRISCEHPISGTGKGTYQFLYGSYQQKEEMTELSTMAGDGGNAHSEYISALSETGWIGALLFLGMVISGFINGVWAYIRYGKNKPESRFWILSLLLGLFSYFIHAVFNNFMYLDSTCFMVFIFWAILSEEYKKSSV